MSMPQSTLGDHVGHQLRRLAALAGIRDASTAGSLVTNLLGAAVFSRLGEPPAWRSGIADDHTPLEYSIALDNNGHSALRLLGETVSHEPSAQANAAALRRVLEALSPRFDIVLNRLDKIQDLFLSAGNTTDFLMWYSLILRPGSPPVFKAYLNPQAHGPDAAPELVGEALHRLGLGTVYSGIQEYACRRGTADQFTFFAVDLHGRPDARVKVYVAHEDALAEDAAMAASMVPGVNPAQVPEFCAALTDTVRFSGRPLLSSYTYVNPQDPFPAGYSLYLPVRDYVDDDEQAWLRLRAMLAARGSDSTILDHAIAAVTPRRLDAGVGLLAHVSLRLGAVRPGITAYLSSEAYSVAAPRSAQPVP